ncbi:MAG: hypothetical protein B6226_06145 [Candidatus Cloacimonetes bacterium 4572_65]|nr:MAG: hypothetical protein B6226_06145 [Candidatus Cloacimonetes bacterium 4572_65]
MFLIIDSENSKILTSRKKLIKIKSENNLTKTQFAFINNLEEMYRLKKSRKQEDIKWNSLLSRVDIIPVELALAQAACESGWGTSGFAQRANNLFGHWTYKQGSGIVPDKREEGATHEIEIFRTVNSSVQKYMRNLNSNSAYYELRVLRKEMRKQERRIEGLVLSKGLRLYSGVGEKYIKTIDSIIKHNIKLMGR